MAFIIIDKITNVRNYQIMLWITELIIHYKIQEQTPWLINVINH